MLITFSFSANQYNLKFNVNPEHKIFDVLNTFINIDPFLMELEIKSLLSSGNFINGLESFRNNNIKNYDKIIVICDFKDKKEENSLLEIIENQNNKINELKDTIIDMNNQIKNLKEKASKYDEMTVKLYNMEKELKEIKEKINAKNVNNIKESNNDLNSNSISQKLSQKKYCSEIKIKIRIFSKDNKQIVYNPEKHNLSWTDTFSNKANLNEQVYLLCDKKIGEYWHANYDEFNSSHTNMFVDGVKVPFSKTWVFKECGEHEVKYVTSKKIKTFKHMFLNCYYITSIDLSNFDTSHVTDMSCMFGQCYMLKYINMENVKTDKVDDMSWMFSSCTNLEKINISSFNMSKVKDISNMFFNCRSLTNINMENNNMEQLVKCNNIFGFCFSDIWIFCSEECKEKIKNGIDKEMVNIHIITNLNKK